MTESTAPAADMGALYQHSVKPEWGLAILAWERDGKRGYRFEDGTLRIFKKGFFKFLTEVDVAADKTRALARALRRDADRNTNNAASLPDEEDRVAFTDQIAFFRSVYPDGFSGKAWLGKKRGEGAKKRLKRHRDAAVDDARDKLAKKALDKMIDAGDFDGVMASLVAVLDGTDLLTKKRVDTIRGITGAKAEKIATALRDILWGEGAFAVRFDTWLASLRAALGKAPGWQIATAPLALVHPEKHVCVRRTTFRAQAAYMAPRLRIGKSPSVAVYQRCRDMTRRVMDRMEDGGLSPIDMLDVYDFMWETLRPKARDEIERRRKESERMAA
jgi:hypothetical protein